MKKPDPFFEHAGVERGDGAESDADGSSEAFVAALLTSLLVDRVAPPKALERACALGAYVASSSGAVPRHEDAPEALRARFRRETAKEEEESTPTAYGGEAERRRAAMEAMEAADSDADDANDADDG